MDFFLRILNRYTLFGSEQPLGLLHLAFSDDDELYETWGPLTCRIRWIVLLSACVTDGENCVRIRAAEIRLHTLLKGQCTIAIRVENGKYFSFLSLMSGNSTKYSVIATVHGMAMAAVRMSKRFCE